MVKSSKIRIYLLLVLILLVGELHAFTMPCSELSDIPETLDELVPVSLKEGKKEIHVFRKYFITKRNKNTADSNPFSETVWTLDIEKDMMFRMRVQSPNTNFKLILSTVNGEILADAPSVTGYGASISNLITTDRVGSDKKALIKFHFYDFLKTPEEIIEHEDVHDCHLPHIVLEMSIMPKDEFISRKKSYNENLPYDAVAKFPDIDSSLIGYHEPSYGNEEDEETSMKLYDDDNLYSLTKTQSDTEGKFEVIKEYHLTISSEEERAKNKNALPLMYYLQLQITADFMTSGSMHVVVVHEKDDSDPLVQKDYLFAYDSLNCAEDLVCVVSQRTAKNIETLNIALTEGNYGVYIIDYQNEGMRNFIADNVKLIPFSSVVNLYPVETQDNSIYCDGLAIPNPYFVPYVIVGGHKFDQRIEIDFRNTTQDIYFDLDTGGSSDGLIVRVTTEQDIGMDVDITIFDSSNNQLAKGKDIGATETVVFKAKSSGKYKVQLSYRNSIIRDLMSCPQVHIYVSSLTDEQAKGIAKIQSDQLGGSTTSYRSIESVFSEMQNAINSGIPYSNDIDFDTIYVFQRESYSDLEEDIYTNKLVLKDKPYWIYIEIL